MPSHPNMPSRLAPRPRPTTPSRALTAPSRVLTRSRRPVGPRSRTVLFALIGVFGVVTSACASHAAEPAPTAAGPSFPVRIAAGGAPAVTVPSQPKRIVSLDSSNTETLFAIGAGSQVVAVDKDSDYPANAPHTQLDATKPNLEAIAGYKPDLVVTAYDTNSIVAGLTKLHIPVLLLPAPTTVDAAYTDWTDVGKATGHAPQAQKLVDSTRQQIATVVAGTKHAGPPLSYYYELDQTYYTATSHTFIGSLLGLFGMTNVADPAESATSGGYPQLSAEQVLKSNPSLIFLADSGCCGQNATTVAARPGWSSLTAVRDGDVVALDDDIASRWGPRIVDLMRTVSTAVAKADKRNG
jgi:iron complex transport system substrate-binding protein